MNYEEKLKEELRLENNLKRLSIDRKCFKKSEQEKTDLANAKKLYKQEQKLKKK